ncbi:hypothetical protein ACTA71_001590 [Dictyostelium dimigraforme]
MFSHSSNICKNKLVCQQLKQQQTNRNYSNNNFTIPTIRASGHVADFMVKDEITKPFYRVDHILVVHIQTLSTLSLVHPSFHSVISSGPSLLSFQFICHFRWSILLYCLSVASVFPFIISSGPSDASVSIIQEYEVAEAIKTSRIHESPGLVSMLYSTNAILIPSRKS